MARLVLKLTCGLSAAYLGLASEDACTAGGACPASAVEALEDSEVAAANVELLQASTQQKRKVAPKKEPMMKEPKKDDAKKEAPKEEAKAALAEKTEESAGASLVSTDANGNVCMLCNKPLPERVDKEYKEYRTDCGGLSSPKGPNATTLALPAAKLTQIGENGEKTKNGFCQLNFAKSCVDAVANKDYLYWAKSLDMKAPDAKANSAWDGRYCRMNGFLEKSMVALQHDFEGTQAKAQELCKTKYAKYNLENITFMDMMSAARYDDESAPSLEEAELLAAWNCAMGDLGCDMALCAYSFCDQDGEGTGLYDDCKGWHPVHGMPVV